jgi:phospholipid-binding lipoprotein MlaA
MISLSLDRLARNRIANFAIAGQKLRSLGIAAAIAAAVAGCATAPPASDAEARAAFNETNDPFEPLNRFVFEFNRGLDFWIMRPLAVAYRDVVPEFARDMVRNFLDNLRTPVVLANDLLQGDTKRAGDTVGRFLTNTILGMGGVFDIATNIPAHSEDFGQTLAVWGLGEGPYLVLPLFGPSPLRDTVGMGVDYVLDPINWWARNTDVDYVTYARTGANGIDLRTRNLETLDEIERSAIDFYATIRSLYRQRRQDEIRNGRPGPSQAPQMSLNGRSDDPGRITALSR